MTHVTKPKETVSKQATVEGIGDPKSADESGAPLEQPTFEAGEFAPRKAAPERSENLAALRTLANDTARQAFQNISRKRLQMSLIGKCAVSGLGLLGGLFLLVLNGFNANVAMIGMIASFVVCLLWGYEAMVLFKQLQIVKAKEASEIANV